jgi:hypothetical protein
MAELVADLEQLPRGSHCLSLHASDREAAEHAAAFLAASEPEQAASYWLADEALLPLYRSMVADRVPDQVGCVRWLEHEQVEPTEGGMLRPTPDVAEFVREHPDGVTAGGETLSYYWSSETLPAHLEYEVWFEEQPRPASRFLCPYDLRRFPAGSAPRTLRELAEHHSHLVLSDSTDRVVRLLELFLFPTATSVPAELREALLWALRTGLVRHDEELDELELSPFGEEVVAEWAVRGSVDWDDNSL